MALSVVIPFLIPLEENIFNATRLLSGLESKKLSFDTYRYCTLVFEDAPVSTPVVTVFARHIEEISVRYSIVGGNKDGLFSVDSKTGRITVAAPLDHEVKSKHTLIVSSQTLDGEKSEATVDVRVADVNDNIPKFKIHELKVTVIEEDQLTIPRNLGKVVAHDFDWVDQNNLLYTLIGDGVDGYSTDDAFFSIDPKSGQITQLRPLDRDPPNGRAVWRLRVKVHDGQNDWVSTRTKYQIRNTSYSNDRKWNSRRKRKVDKINTSIEHTAKKSKFCPDGINCSNNISSIKSTQTESTSSVFKIAFVESFHLHPQKNKRLGMIPRRFKVLSHLRKISFVSKNVLRDDFYQRSMKIKRKNYRSRMNVLKSMKFNKRKKMITIKSQRDINDYQNLPQTAFTRSMTYDQALDKERRHFPSQIQTKELKISEKNAFSKSVRQIRHIGVKDNCDILESLIKPLDSSQKARLKYLISQQKKNLSPKQEVHVVEAMVTILVTDINDNPPVFPNTTIHVEVQENGPKDLFVAIVSAWDADDPGSAANAQLRYYLEKNAVDERNGAPIFRINASSGEIRTSLCCLDRESTFEYLLQVVATDGGGLKGTGTVAIRLTDVNDNTPKFARQEWKVVIDETPGMETPDNSTLFEITVNDPDTSNKFLFRVVEASGWGWNFFGIRTSDSVGEVFATRPLDFENSRQRDGFRFLVEVTDRGSWEDTRNVESAWVVVELRDINDNLPIFHETLIHVTISEDIQPDSIVARVTAIDPDQDGIRPVTYRLVDDWGDLKISKNGEIRTLSHLDREGPFGSRGLVLILAIDQGTPPKTSTATLVLTVSDVNDCAPRLIGVQGLHVRENAPPTKVGTLFATDDDVWALGHGPPFTFQFDQVNPSSVFDKFDLKFLKDLDSGRGGAELWSKKPLDREESRNILIKVLIKDAANLASINDLSVIVDDVNDNDMKPANKIIYVWKTKGAASKTSIGRIYVNDPDDWDVVDKTYEWVTSPHPLFKLYPDSGVIEASPLIREGRYELQFKVSDSFRDQRDVSANVTVQVGILDTELLMHAVAITFLNISPQDFTKDWSPISKTSRMAKLETMLLDSFSDHIDSVKIVSISEGRSITNLISEDGSRLRFSTVVWVTARDKKHNLIATAKLRGLMDIKKYQIERDMQLKVTLEDVVASERPPSEEISGVARESPMTLSSASSSLPLLLPTSINRTHLKPSSIELNMDRLPLQVIDTNSTSLVTPLLSRSFYCPDMMNVSHSDKDRFAILRDKVLPTDDRLGCNFKSCLNGGKCVPSPKGSRCICPGWTWGKRCKALVRSFKKEGFAWLDPLNPCFPLIISLKFLTKKNNGILLYSGPLSDRSRLMGHKIYKNPYRTPSPLLALQIHADSLELHIVGKIGKVLLRLKSEGSTSFSDGKWHIVHIFIDQIGASLMSDYCTAGWRIPSINSSHCFDHHRWTRSIPEQHPWKVPWQISLPLQVGGTAHDMPHRESHGWIHQPVVDSFEGCISELKINFELMDLGDLSFSSNSKRGCPMQDKSCSNCLPWGMCSGGVSSEAFCSCYAGFLGQKCLKKSNPVTLRYNDSAKVSLAFTPDPFRSTFQMSIKTVSKSASILHLYSVKDTSFLRLYITDGRVCLDFKSRSSTEENKYILREVTAAPYEDKIPESKIQLKIKEFSNRIKESFAPKDTKLTEDNINVCLTSVDVSDGTWHLLKGGRYGSNVLLEVDGGEGFFNNESLAFLNTKKEIQIPREFWVDEKEGVLIGNGKYKQINTRYQIASNSQKICIDDLRLFGKSIPLTATFNYSSKWAIVITPSILNAECDVVNECKSFDCMASGSCKIQNKRIDCGCPAGHMPTPMGCKKYDPCFYVPCLHGGTCSSIGETSNCSCNPSFVGEYCQWPLDTIPENDLTTPIIAVSVTMILLLLAICGGFLWKYFGNRRKNQSSASSSFISPVTLESSPSKMTPSFGTCSSNGDPSQMDESLDQTNTRLSDFKIQISKNSATNVISEQPSRQPVQINSLSLIIDDSLSKAGKENCSYYRDDLRAYAYEGDGLSSGSIGSAISGLREEYKHSLEVIPVTFVLKDVVDLLKDLPDGRTSTLKKKKYSKTKVSQYSSTPKISIKCDECCREQTSPFQPFAKIDKTL